MSITAVFIFCLRNLRWLGFLLIKSKVNTQAYVLTWNPLHFDMSAKTFYCPLGYILGNWLFYSLKLTCILTLEPNILLVIFSPQCLNRVALSSKIRCPSIFLKENPCGMWIISSQKMGFPSKKLDGMFNLDENAT